MQGEHIILGIDPGTTIMGYGLILIKNKKPSLITLGTIQLSKLKDSLSKLEMIYNRVDQIINEYKPNEVAFEAPFYGKNVQSMLKLGRAQGVALGPALKRGIPVFEYAPRKIKQAITGQGAASKEQVASLITHILNLKKIPDQLDATDGVAVALCHFYKDNLISNQSNAASSSWESYIKKNPGRVH